MEDALSGPHEHGQVQHAPQGGQQGQGQAKAGQDGAQVSEIKRYTGQEGQGQAQTGLDTGVVGRQQNGELEKADKINIGIAYVFFFHS